MSYMEMASDRPASILVTIPHYFDPGGSGRYGSTRQQAALRAASLRETIIGLWRTFAGTAARLDIAGKRASQGPRRFRLSVQVVTVAEKHLVPKLRLPGNLYQHVAVRLRNPLLLGFECHRILSENLGAYDWFAFLEDDLVIRDPLFLDKLAWFQAIAGADKVLQPNRFEDRLNWPVTRLYIDGPLRPALTARYREGQPLIAAPYGSRMMHFAPALNPHAGCFFLTARQMRRWAEAPHFLDRETSFVGPLESAASLGLMQTFSVYKTTPACCDFLEIEHAAPVYIGMVGKEVELASELQAADAAPARAAQAKPAIVVRRRAKAAG